MNCFLKEFNLIAMPALFQVLYLNIERYGLWNILLVDPAW